MSETQVEPPVMKDDKLVVRCATSGCNHTTEIGTDIDAVQASDDRSTWRISFIPSADGRLEVDEAECPVHRVSDAIDTLAQEQYEFAEEFAKTTKIADKLSS